MAVTVVIEVHAADQNADLWHGDVSAHVELPPQPAFTFWERFRDSFDRCADVVFADRFHPLNAMTWSMESAGGDAASFRDLPARVAYQALARSGVHSVREATVDLPILFWLEERQGLLAEFFSGSVGNVGEEAVAPLDVSYRPVERLWWRGLSESSAVRFGLRPFRTSPYAYLSLRLNDAGGLVVLADLRYYYRDFADHHFELALSLPLRHGLTIDIGTSYQFGRHEDEARLVVKLSKEVKAGSILHIGCEVKEHPALLAGITFSL